MNRKFNVDIWIVSNTLKFKEFLVILVRRMWRCDADWFMCMNEHWRQHSLLFSSFTFGLVLDIQCCKDRSLTEQSHVQSIEEVVVHIFVLTHTQFICSKFVCVCQCRQHCMETHTHIMVYGDRQTLYIGIELKTK